MGLSVESAMNYGKKFRKKVVVLSAVKSLFFQNTLVRGVEMFAHILPLLTCRLSRSRFARLHRTQNVLNARCAGNEAFDVEKRKKWY